MDDPSDDIENRLAACRPRLSSAERDGLLFQAARASERKRLFKQTVSYAALSSMLSAAACFAVMTVTIGPLAGENKIAGSGSSPSARTSAKAVERVERRKQQTESEPDSEIPLRPQGVLTAASWSRWEEIEKQNRAQLDAPSESNLSHKAAETKPLAVRSNFSAL